MIRPTAENRLHILLPGTNKALAEVLRQATPEQLSLLNESKDIRGVLESLARDAARSDRSTPLLQELLKNTPALQNMGNPVQTLATLAQSLKQEALLPQLQARLEAFVKNPETATASELKRLVADSGLFYESRLAASAEPLKELRHLLSDLQTRLEPSSHPAAKTVKPEIAALIGSLERTEPPAPGRIIDALERILAPMKQAVAARDPLQSPKLEKLLAALQRFELPRSQQTQQNQQSHHPVTPDTQPAPTHAAHKPQSSKPLANPAAVAVINQPAGEAKTAESSRVLSAAPAAEPQAKTPQGIEPLKTLLSDLHTLALQSRLEVSRPLIKEVETLFRLVEPLEVLPDTPETAAILDDKLSRLGSRLERVLDHADALIRKESVAIARELRAFTDPLRLQPGAGAERLADDLKAIAHEAHDALQKAPASPAASEALRQSERLLLQIDYFQLSSYLSSATALYLPYSWEMLDGGTLTFYKPKERQFHCRIDLNLKDFGALRLMLVLSDDKKIDIQAYAPDATLRERLTQALPVLRSALREAGLIPQKLGVAVPRGDAPGGYGEGSAQDLGMGFEVKI